MKEYKISVVIDAEPERIAMVLAEFVASRFDGVVADLKVWKK